MFGYDAQTAFYALDRCRDALPGLRNSLSAGSPERQALDELIAAHLKVDNLLFDNVRSLMAIRRRGTTS